MNTRSTPIITARQVSKIVETSAGLLTILQHISLQINAAESVALVGVSGSGKSTLLGLLAGLDLPSSGHIELAGALLHQLDEDDRAALRRQHVGFVFQSFLLLPNLTVLENVMLPLELSHHPAAEREARGLLERVGLGQRSHHYPKQISGGEQQRVAIARAFATHPTILFADEPTGNLDSQTGAHIIELLFELNRERGTTLVLVTHDEALADRCSRKVRIDGGQVVGDHNG